MSSACRSALLFAALICIACASGARELRVCADPDNLPLSHENGSGFENRIARLVADEMHAELRYTWLPLRRGFVRKTIDAGLCDVFIGVPKDFDRVATTRPYYRSSYVFVDGPAARGIEAFDDARLRVLHVGVQLVGNDLAATPAGHALAINGYSDNVRGFTIYGATPASERMIAAVAAGELDVALVWGPQAGYFATRSTQALEIHVARLHPGIAGIPLEFDIAMGVRKGDVALRDELDAIIERRRRDIDAILTAYAVPRTDLRRAEVP
jgi:quinoprotein dehydrogenase-associated probable ABC transporter substrate-binding protein